MKKYDKLQNLTMAFDCSRRDEPALICSFFRNFIAFFYYRIEIEYLLIGKMSRRINQNERFEREKKTSLFRRKGRDARGIQIAREKKNFARTERLSR